MVNQSLNVIHSTFVFKMRNSRIASMPAFVFFMFGMLVLTTPSYGVDIEWSSFFGGTYNDFPNGVAIDSQNNIIIAGHTGSGNWWNGAGFTGGWITDPSLKGGFVIKMSPAGELLWSSYLHGQATDVAVDQSDNIYITGETTYSNWGILSGPDTTRNGTDAFIVKLSSAGGHVWSSYLGGSAFERGEGVAIDGSGDVLVVGETRSNDWWNSAGMSGGDDLLFGGGTKDGFLVKLSSGGSHLWSTYLGGNTQDVCYDVAVNNAGLICVTGMTYDSSDWRNGQGFSGGIDLDFNGGTRDGFLVTFNSSGIHQWSTYVGGNGNDDAFAVATDSSGCVFVSGYTTSLSWGYPMSGGWCSVLDGASDAFLVKYADDGSHVWSSYVGGSGVENGGFDVAVGLDDSVYMVGETYSTGWLSGGWDAAYHAAGDGFAIKFASDGSHLWGSYLGLNANDILAAVAVDNLGYPIIAGKTKSGNYVVIDGWDMTFNASGYYDGVVAVVDDIAPTTTDPTINEGSSQRHSIKSIAFSFSEPVVIDSDDLLIYHHDGSSWTLLPSIPSIQFDYDAINDIATWEGQDLFTTSGHYVLLLDTSSITDAYGNCLSPDSDGDSVADFYRFHVLPGDIDGDLAQTSVDIDTLFDLVDLSDPACDINCDDVVSDADVTYLVETVLGTYYADANLDGSTNINDFIILKQNLYTYGGWSVGDFNGDDYVDDDDYAILVLNYTTGTPITLLSLGLAPVWP